DIWRSVRQFGGFGDARYKTAGAFIAWWNRTSTDYAALARTDPRCTLICFERLAAGEEATLDALERAAGVGRTEALGVLQRKIATGGGTPRRVAVPEAELRAIAQGCRSVWNPLR
ncbi:MAG TPA: hypothetical protein VFK80_03490, partial [Limnochordia bacterium]|nr:hypothetical protein [Limnochordia bacterium]